MYSVRLNYFICGCFSFALEKESMQPGSLQRIHDLIAIWLLHSFSSKVSLSFMPLSSYSPRDHNENKVNADLYYVIPATLYF